MVYNANPSVRLLIFNFPGPRRSSLIPYRKGGDSEIGLECPANYGHIDFSPGG